MTVKFEGQDRREATLAKVLPEYGFKSLEDARELCLSKGIDVDAIVKGIQPIAFDNASWAYTLGCAIAIKKGIKNAADAAEAIGLGLQAFAVPGSVGDRRQVGIGHGNLAAMLLREETNCFCFLAGHESFAAAEGAIGIARNAKETPYSDGERAKVRCYGADDVNEGVAIMIKEGVDVSITGNSTNPTRFQHPVAGTYKKWCWENGRKYFSVASGGGTGRTLHPDNVAAGPASYGMTDTMGRMHGDAQFAGSSSVPAHVEMMGVIGMGNNPMVGATVAVAVAVENAMK